MNIHTSSASQYVFASSAAFAFDKLTDAQRTKIMKMLREMTEKQRKPKKK